MLFVWRKVLKCIKQVLKRGSEPYLVFTAIKLVILNLLYICSVKRISVNYLKHLFLFFYNLRITRFYPFLERFFVTFKLGYFLNNKISFNQWNSFRLAHIFAVYFFLQIDLLNMINWKKIDFLKGIIFWRSRRRIDFLLLKKIDLFLRHQIY